MDKKHDSCQCIVALLLMLYIGVMAAVNMATPSRVFSESENRMLEQAPHFSLADLLHGKFTSDYEKYIADQFSWRDFWIGVRSDVERALGRNESNGVYLGRDGYLLQKFTEPSGEAFQHELETINAVAVTLPGLRKYLLLAPTSVKMLADKLPAHAPVDDELACLNKVRRSLDKSITYVDVYDALYSKRGEGIYYKTDHHWTTRGAYYTYRKLGDAMGFTPHDESCFQITRVTDSFYGSLYSKGGFRRLQPDTIELYMPRAAEQYQVYYYDDHKTADSLYAMDNLDKKDKYAVFLGGNKSLIKITTNANSEKKLLLLKDSYANCLIPFLTGHYREIYMVDLRYYSDNLNDLAKTNGITDLLMLYNVSTFFGDTPDNAS